MLTEVVLSLSYIAGVNEAGKDIKKTRRFNQVRMNLNDNDLQTFKELVQLLTGEVYYNVEKIETKLLS